MNKHKVINGVIALVLAMVMYIGLIALIGYEWDKSPTTTYQDEISQKV